MTELISPNDIHKVMVEAGQETFKGGASIRHYGDLYVFVNDITTEIVNRYSSKSIVQKFRSSLPENNGAMMYDIPFAWNAEFQKAHNGSR